MDKNYEGWEKCVHNVNTSCWYNTSILKSPWKYEQDCSKCCPCVPTVVFNYFNLQSTLQRFGVKQRLFHICLWSKLRIGTRINLVVLVPCTIITEVVVRCLILILCWRSLELRSSRKGSNNGIPERYMILPSDVSNGSRMTVRQDIGPYPRIFISRRMGVHISNNPVDKKFTEDSNIVKDQ